MLIPRRPAGTVARAKKPNRSGAQHYLVAASCQILGESTRPRAGEGKGSPKGAAAENSNSNPNPNDAPQNDAAASSPPLKIKRPQFPSPSPARSVLPHRAPPPPLPTPPTRHSKIAPAYTSACLSAMPSAVVVRRARSRSPPGRFDSSRRTRLRVEEKEAAAVRVDEDAEMAALPDDMLLEVFNRLPPPTGVFRCAAVCRRWRRVVSRAGGLPAPPRHFGFFRNYGPSPLPPFVPTAGVALDLRFLPVSPTCGVILVDCRGHRLLLRELGAGFQTELKLLVCNPLDRQGAEFRVVVVLFGITSPNFYVLIYSSASSAWEVATGALKRPLVPHKGPSVVVGDVVYRLECDDKYIMAINTAKMTLSALTVPNAGMLLYTGNNWIGKTEDGWLCFFAIREPLLLVKWVLEAPGKWTPEEPVALRPLMNQANVGDLHNMKLSAKIADQLHGCKLVSFGGFCEATGTLFFIMADWVVSLHLKTLTMERLWLNDDEWRPLGDVFPFEMVAWPPVIKDYVDSVKAPVIIGN
uniref:Uncharacterized protein n=1 Tax=Avena sativa TaxID=4498 RepID=A0ACD6A4J5_AVESA